MEGKIKHEDYHYFVLAEGNGQTYWFTTYRKLNGSVQRLLETEIEGNKVWRKITLKKDQAFPVYKEDKQLLEFMKNHPNCPDSPEFTGKVVFYRHDPERDAQTQLNDIMLETDAVVAVKELAGKRLLEIAALCGMSYSLDQERQCKTALTLFAKRNPQRVLDAIQTPDKQAHIVYIVREAMAKGNIVRENSVYKFAGHVLGIDEDGVVATLQSKAELLELIERRNSIGNEEAPAKRGRKAQ